LAFRKKEKRRAKIK